MTLSKTVARKRWEHAYSEHGYPVGPEDADLNGLAEHIGGELVLPAEDPDEGVAVYEVDDILVAVGDAQGPLAVDLE